jgi:deoxyribodipyrimidine photo-lyase
MSIETCIVWFKRDLRVADHTALAHAAQAGFRVLPVYVIEPEYWALKDTSARQWGFTRECLAELSNELAGLGAPLVVCVGNAVEQLDRLQRIHGVTRMVSHEETGNLWTFQRDLAVGEWAQRTGVEWQEFAQSGVVRRLNGRDGWAAKRNRFVAGQVLDAPKSLIGAQNDVMTVPDLDLMPDPCPERQIGGRSVGLGLLGSFLLTRGQTYRKAMSSPVEGEWACSRISPYLAVGALSGREAAQAGKRRAAQVKGTRIGWSGATKSFQARLAWRDHFMQKLEDEPQIEARCLHRAYENMRPSEPDAARLQAWAVGETGVPFVDACMRFTRATGWLNFRMRAMVTSFASYHLWLDWRAHGPILARYFTDYEPGIHWSQVQMQSGTTGMNTVRVYNPVKQGHDQDPNGAFVRRWCPELADVPDAHLQEPWRWDGAGKIVGQVYPRPIVDLQVAAKAARDAVWGVRKGTEFKREAGRIVHKHASRKDRNGFFVNDREPAKPKSSEQLSFDL